MQKFNCPICHREIDPQDSHIHDVVTKSQHQRSHIRGRTITHTYLDTHYYVRECKRCSHIQSIIRWTINLAIIVGCGFLSFKSPEAGGIVMQILSAALMIFLVWLIFGNLLYFIIYKIFFEPDIDYAYNHNALVSKDEYEKQQLPQT